MNKTGSSQNLENNPVPVHPIMQVRNAEESIALMMAMRERNAVNSVPSYLNEM